MRVVRLPYLVFLGVLLSSQWLSALCFAEVPELIPFRKAALWGFCDAQDRLVIPAHFEAAWPFEDQIAKVKQNGKVGVIRNDGDWLIPAQYEEIQFGKLLRLKQNNRFGLASRDGRILFPATFEGIFPIKNDYFLLVAGGKKGLCDAAGKLIIPIQYDHIAQLRDHESNYVDLFEFWEFGVRGVYNACGTQVQHARFSRIDVFKNGFAIVQEEEHFGLIDLEGTLRMDCQYDQLAGPSEDLLAAKVKNRWGFVDVEGNQVIPFVYEEVQENGFYQGRAAVKKVDEWYFIDRNGEVEFPLNAGFQSVGGLSEGLVAVCSLIPNGGVQYGYSDPTGKMRIPFRYERAEAFRKGFAIVGVRKEKDQSIVREMRYGVIDPRGREIVPINLRSQTEARLKRDSLSHLGFTTLLAHGKQCRVDFRGRKFDWKKDRFDPSIPHALGQNCVDENLVAVEKNGKWGFENNKGKIVIPCQYALVQCFSNGLALVWPEEGNPQSYYIDETGKAYFSQN